MEKIKYYIEKYKALSILIIVILFLALCLIFSLTSKSSSKVEKIDDLKIENKEEAITEPQKIKVDIKGLVNTPGVYEMDMGSRVIDVINKAGGLIEESNTEYINLSKKLVDEMIIIIYSNNDVEKFKETDKEVIYIEYECVCPDNKNDACITDKDTVNTNGVKKANSENSEKNNNTSVEKNGKISINTGTLEELMSLDGVGESKAKSIIDYREQNGEFKNLEDLMNVSGIGEKAYSKIKDNIKL